VKAFFGGLLLIASSNSRSWTRKAKAEVGDQRSEVRSTLLLLTSGLRPPTSAFPSLEKCPPFDVRHSPDAINLLSLFSAQELIETVRARRNFQADKQGIFREH
jgi:hypothetical protein